MKHQGFTLIELVVTVTVMMVLVGGVIAGYNNFNENQKVKQAALTIKSNLRLAQAKALSAEKTKSFACSILDGYTVSFSNVSGRGRYDIRASCTNGAPANNEALIVDLPVGVSFVPLPSPASFVFEVLAKGVRISGNVNITVSGLNRTYQLRISPSGDIMDCGFGPSYSGCP